MADLQEIHLKLVNLLSINDNHFVVLNTVLKIQLSTPKNKFFFFGVINWKNYLVATNPYGTDGSTLIHIPLKKTFTMAL